MRPLPADHGGKMMDKDIFKERERSLEEEYFRKHEAKLIEKLRERAKIDEIAEALAVKLQTDDPALLRRIMALGVTLDTGNLVMRLDDPVEAVARLAPHVLATHVKDAVLAFSAESWK